MADRIQTKRDIAWISVLEELGVRRSVTPYKLAGDLDDVDVDTIRGVCKTMETRGWLARESEHASIYYPTIDLASIVIPGTAQTLGQ